MLAGRKKKKKKKKRPEQCVSKFRTQRAISLFSCLFYSKCHSVSESALGALRQRCRCSRLNIYNLGQMGWVSREPRNVGWGGVGGGGGVGVLKINPTASTIKLGALRVRPDALHCGRTLPCGGGFYFERSWCSRRHMFFFLWRLVLMTGALSQGVWSPRYETCKVLLPQFISWSHWQTSVHWLRQTTSRWLRFTHQPIKPKTQKCLWTVGGSWSTITTTWRLTCLTPSGLRPVWAELLIHVNVLRCADDSPLFHHDLSLTFLFTPSSCHSLVSS